MPTPIERAEQMQYDLELLPEEKIAVFDRFEQAFAEWRRHHYNAYGETENAFYAGYRAGYGHANDDAQQTMKGE